MAGFPPFASNVQELLVGYYGVALVTKPRETDYTIGTSLVTLGKTDDGRRAQLTLSNAGTTNIWFGNNPALASPNGNLLQPGGFARLHWLFDGDWLDRVFYAISSGAGGALHITECFFAGG